MRTSDRRARVHLRTCGRLIPIALLIVPAARAEDAIELLHHMQEALGGPRLLQIRDLDWMVKAKVWDAAGHDAGNAARRIRVILPSDFRKDQDFYVRRDQHTPNAHTRFYFDGRSGWGSFADMSRFADTPVTLLKDSDLRTVQKEVKVFWLNLWRADGRTDYDISVCRPHTLRFAYEGDRSIAMDVEIDPATGLPRRSGDLCETEGKALSGNYTETIEWMVADGIKVPRRILNYHRGRLVADIHTISARFDTGLKREDLAHRP